MNSFKIDNACATLFFFLVLPLYGMILPSALVFGDFLNGADCRPTHSVLLGLMGGLTLASISALSDLGEDDN